MFLTSDETGPREIEPILYKVFLARAIS